MTGLVRSVRRRIGDAARTGRRARWRGWLPALACAAALQAPAQELPADELEQRCWLSHTRERTRANLRESTAVEFSNLRSGYEVRSPFAVDFAVRGLGVAPAGVRIDETGHHHLLVDRSLPRSVTGTIPFDPSYRHFGMGQTSTVLELPNGRHTLRLLFADYQHRPYFVFSREIEVTVVGPRAGTPSPKIDPTRFVPSCAAWYADALSTPPPPGDALRLLNVRAGEPLVSPFNLRLGVTGLGVCAVGGKAEKCGHFVLELLDARTRRPVQSHRLTQGATQLNVFIATGDYLARLRLVDEGGSDLLPPHEMPLRVAREESL